MVRSSWVDAKKWSLSSVCERGEKLFLHLAGSYHSFLQCRQPFILRITNIRSYWVVCYPTFFFTKAFRPLSSQIQLPMTFCNSQLNWKIVDNELTAQIMHSPAVNYIWKAIAAVRDNNKEVKTIFCRCIIIDGYRKQIWEGATSFKIHSFQNHK